MTNLMNTKNFNNTTDELMNAVLDEQLTVEQACEVCPYAGQCDANDLYFGCGVWEVSMGDDL